MYTPYIMKCSEVWRCDQIHSPLHYFEPRCCIV